MMDTGSKQLGSLYLSHWYHTFSRILLRRLHHSHNGVNSTLLLSSLQHNIFGDVTHPQESCSEGFTIHTTEWTVPYFFQARSTTNIFDDVAHPQESCNRWLHHSHNRVNSKYPTSFKLTAQLTFSMMSHTFKNPATEGFTIHVIHSEFVSNNHFKRMIFLPASCKGGFQRQ